MHHNTELPVSQLALQANNIQLTNSDHETNGVSPGIAVEQRHCLSLLHLPVGINPTDEIISALRGGES